MTWRIASGGSLLGTQALTGVGANIVMPKLAVIYTDDARGKTTLCGILFSLGRVDPFPISERRRLSATQPSHVVVQLVGWGRRSAFRMMHDSFSFPGDHRPAKNCLLTAESEQRTLRH